MDISQAWVMPFTFISGVGLLILSTSTRYYHVKELIREIIVEDSKKELWSYDNLIKRAHLFHRALVLLYLAIGSFSLSAMIANLNVNWFKASNHICFMMADGLMLIGVFCVVITSVLLIQEATVSLKHIEDKKIKKKH